MTLSTTNLRNQYYGDGATATFPITFQFQKDTEIQVTVLDIDGLTEITRDLTTHFTVSGGNGAAGSITFTSGNIPSGNGLPGSQRITINRNMRLVQDAVISPNDPFPSKIIENQIADRQVMLLQQVQEQLDRCLKLFTSSSLSVLPELTDPVANASLVYSSDAKRLIPGPTVSEITTSLATAAAAAAAAAASALAAQNYAESYVATSSSSVTIGTSIKVFQIPEGKLFEPGNVLMIVFTGDPSKFMNGTVQSLVGTTLTMNITTTSTVGGTFNSWKISVSGVRGATGATGAPGAGTGDMLGANNLSDVSDINTARVNIDAAKDGVNNDITALNALISINGGALGGLFNHFVNGNFQIAQRGQVNCTNGTYYGGCDGFINVTTATSVSAGVVKQTANSNSDSGFAQHISGLTTSGTTTVGIRQRSESVNVYDMNSNSITISGQVYQDTGSSQTLSVGVFKANAVDNFSATTQLGSYSTVSIPSGVMTPFSFTFSIGFGEADNGLQFDTLFRNISAVTAKNFFFIDFDARIGNAAPSYREILPIALELTRCQRYLRKYTDVFIGIAKTGVLTYQNGIVYLSTTMRAAPTLVAGSSFVASYGSNGTPGLGGYTTQDAIQLFNTSANWSVDCFVVFSGLVSAEL